MLHFLAQAALEDARIDARNLSHAQRSTVWITSLARRLVASHDLDVAARNSLKAFCRADESNRAEFRVNELLFDILIAETRTVDAANRTQKLAALSRAIWIVESELKRSDSRAVLIDLNKLVVAKADNKVLVVSSGTPLVRWAKGVIEKLLDPNESTVFLLTIPHPADWFATEYLRADVFQLTSGGWLTDPSSGQPTAAAHVGR